MRKRFLLYLIEILHQTTTRVSLLSPLVRLYLIEILHQTTTFRRCSSWSSSCILSKFYIKPQRNRRYFDKKNVVSYRNSTSNHNSASFPIAKLIVVSYRNSTSNHNSDSSLKSRILVVSYRNSTSNHNGFVWLSKATQLYLIEILHQTTTTSIPCALTICCILSKFYIKPQRRASY